MPVTFSFEPRRAIAEGEALADRRQPWRNIGNHLPGLTATVLIRSKDGAVLEEVPASYAGLGVYRAARLFTPSEVGEGRAYLVSLLFTDPYNGESIGVENNTYPLEVSGEPTR
ncbi:MAG: hypothetical protein NTZ05_22775 [Chloroflexi bacterium]|nr:hypothetical protein [Chloroflexota bacterium]